MMTNSTKVGVAAIIFKDEEVLIGKRISKAGNGRYSLPGGAVELNESVIEAFKREVLEETGLTVTNVYPTTWKEINGNELYSDNFLTIYAICYVENFDDLANMEPDKTEGWEWVDIKYIESGIGSYVGSAFEGKNPYQPILLWQDSHWDVISAYNLLFPSDEGCV